MKRKRTRLGLLLAALIFSVCGVVQAQEADQAKLGVDLDATYVSKYIWRGYDLFDDHGAFQPSVNVDLFGTGFSVNVWGSIPTGTGSNNQGGGINQWQEYDYTAAYGCSVFEEKVYQVDLGVNYIYYHFPKLNHMADTQEIGASVALPNLIKLGDIALVPSYYVGKLWPTSSGVADVAGGFHTLALSCDLPVPCPLRKDTQQVFSFFTDITYNDGAFAADHDWSHSTMGVSTGIEVGPVTVTPALYYQISMDDSVNDEDELWGGLSVSYSF